MRTPRVAWVACVLVGCSSVTIGSALGPGADAGGVDATVDAPDSAPLGTTAPPTSDSAAPTSPDASPDDAESGAADAADAVAFDAGHDAGWDAAPPGDAGYCHMTGPNCAGSSPYTWENCPVSPAGCSPDSVHGANSYCCPYPVLDAGTMDGYVRCKMVVGGVTYTVTACRNTLTPSVVREVSWSSASPSPWGGYNCGLGVPNPYVWGYCTPGTQCYGFDGVNSWAGFCQ
jgi:hypothetical protein